MERALKVASSNACMKRIVAAPTAGSCGVVPAVLITMQEEFEYSDEEMVEALYIVAGIGSASAMAAAAVAYLKGGTNEEIVHASALALKGLLGLACDQSPDSSKFLVSREM